MTAKHSNPNLAHRYVLKYKRNLSKKIKDVVADYWNNIDGYFIFRANDLLQKYSLTRGELTRIVRESADCIVTETCSKCLKDYERRARTKNMLYLPVNEIRICDSCQLIIEKGMEAERIRERQTSQEKLVVNSEREAERIREVAEWRKLISTENQFQFGDNIVYGNFMIGCTVDSNGQPALLISGRNDVEIIIKPFSNTSIKIIEY